MKNYTLVLISAFFLFTGLSYPLLASETLVFDKPIVSQGFKGVVKHVITPGKELVDNYENRLAAVFDARTVEFPEKPSFTISAKGVLGHGDAIVFPPFSCVQDISDGTCSLRYFEMNTNEIGELEPDKVLLTVRGNGINKFFHHVLNKNMNVDSNLNVKEIEWVNSVEFLEDSLERLKLFLAGKDGYIVSLSALGYSDLMLETVDAILESGLPINEIWVNKLAVTRTKGENPLIEVSYDPSDFANAEVVARTVLSLSISSDGGFTGAPLLSIL